MRARAYLTVICIGLMSVQGGFSRTTTRDDCRVIEDALKRIDDLKPGDLRAKLEQSFELDGGLQFPARSRYVFKTCRYIKVEVELSSEGIQARTDFLPSDKIVKISRPYLEHPVYD